MEFFKLFLIGVGVFLMMAFCMYIFNGYRVTSLHNRAKRDRTANRQRQAVFVITRQINANIAEETGASSSTSAVVHPPPPDYATLNPSALDSVRPLDVCPPPSYNEATRGDRRTDS